MAENENQPKLPNIASEPNAPSQYVNIFRVRADRYSVVVDFSYIPPLDANEMKALASQPLPVVSRVLMPYDLVPQLLESLSKTYEAATKSAAPQEKSAEASKPASAPSGIGKINSLRR